MKYKITNKTSGTCAVTLLPENEAEQNLLRDEKDEFTFFYHYTQAVKKHIHPNAECLSVIDSEHFPSPVTIKYQVATGLGGH